MFALLMEPYAMIQVSILLQPRRTAAGANSFQAISVCFGGNPVEKHWHSIPVVLTQQLMLS